MERPEIITILKESLHCRDEREQYVAFEFLSAVLVRRNEPLANRSRAGWHLGRYQARRALLWGWSAVRRVRPFIVDRYHAARPGMELAAGSLSAISRKARGVAHGLGISAALTLSRGKQRSYDLCLWTIAVLVRTCEVAAGAYRRGAGVVADIRVSVLRGLGRSRRSFYHLYRRLADGVKGGAGAVAGEYRSAVGSLYRILAWVAYEVVSFRVYLYGLCCGLIDGIAGMRAAVAGTFRRAMAAVRDVWWWVTDALRSAQRSLYRLCSRIARAIVSAGNAVVNGYRTARRIAYMELLPETSIRYIVPAVVVVVILMFGVNWYLIVSDVNRKGIFVDMTTYRWGDEALASIMVGEAYDIYHQEKITEKKIQELLASGKYYERVIHVTGYYSPLPNQTKYATGSYWGDIVLNGRGIVGGDTTPVYIGMAAGPPHMEFGTNLIIKDLGKFDLPKVYTVHDRGGPLSATGSISGSAGGRTP